MDYHIWNFLNYCIITDPIFEIWIPRKYFSFNCWFYYFQFHCCNQRQFLFGERVMNLAHSPVIALEDFIWAQPNHGRLTGTVINRGDNGIILYDSIGYQWVINTENLLPKSLETIKTRDHVRIVGIRSEISHLQRVRYSHGNRVISVR